MLPRILIVSDDPFLGALYVEKFEAMSCIVELVGDAAADRSIIEAFRPHATLLTAATPTGAREGVHIIRSYAGGTKVAITVLSGGESAGVETFEGVTVVRKATATPTEVVAAVRRSLPTRHFDV
ncbi:hypothetical protein HYW67_01705 [Candidatus Parcubacteria bacterium]|nr:hypothetical protein [Candidatus Parcubacteria bacterium]